MPVMMLPALIKRLHSQFDPLFLDITAQIEDKDIYLDGNLDETNFYYHNYYQFMYFRRPAPGSYGTSKNT